MSRAALPVAFLLLVAAPAQAAELQTASGYATWLGAADSLDKRCATELALDVATDALKSGVEPERIAAADFSFLLGQRWGASFAKAAGARACKLSAVGLLQLIQTTQAVR